MATYYVDDGNAGPTYDGASWATAYTSLTALDTAVALAADDIVYVGHDHVCQASHGGNTTFTGSTANPPCRVISVTQGSSPPTYEVATANQVDTTEAAYSWAIYGGAALYGLRVKAGSNISINAPSDETVLLEDVYLLPAAGGFFAISGDPASLVRITNLTIDHAADASSQSVRSVSFDGTGMRVEINGIKFLSAGFRRQTSVFASAGTGYRFVKVSGADCSLFTNGDDQPLVIGSFGGDFVGNNIRTKSGFTPWSSAAAGVLTNILLSNCGPDNDPWYLAHRNYFGQVIASSAIYRDTGASVEGTSVSWQVQTSAQCSEGAPYVTPWIHGVVSTTGSKTFSIPIVHDSVSPVSSAVDDSKAWIEVEFLGTTAEPDTTFSKSQRVITATAAAHTTDSESWTGTGPSFTNKRLLQKTVTVNVAGQFRARVAVGVTSIGSSANFYVDPKVTVT